MRGLGGLGLRVLGGFLRLEEEREHQKNLRCCLVLVLEENHIRSRCEYSSSDVVTNTARLLLQILAWHSWRQ